MVNYHAESVQAAVLQGEGVLDKQKNTRGDISFSFLRLIKRKTKTPYRSGFLKE